LLFLVISVVVLIVIAFLNRGFNADLKNLVFKEDD
jgi:ABC-type lipoprotein release transport system permease subunit